MEEAAVLKAVGGEVGGVVVDAVFESGWRRNARGGCSRLAAPGLRTHQDVVAEVGEPLSQDRRIGGLARAFQVLGRLLVVGPGVRQAAQGDEEPSDPGVRLELPRVAADDEPPQREGARLETLALLAARRVRVVAGRVALQAEADAVEVAEAVERPPVVRVQEDDRLEEGRRVLVASVLLGGFGLAREAGDLGELRTAGVAAHRVARLLFPARPGFAPRAHPPRPDPRAPPAGAGNGRPPRRNARGPRDRTPPPPRGSR